MAPSGFILNYQVARILVKCTTFWCRIRTQDFSNMRSTRARNTTELLKNIVARTGNWDRYQVLKMEQYVFIWGCVDLPNSTGHEEGLWVLKQYNSGNVLEWKREIQKIFPIGLITIEDLQSPGLDFSDEEIRIECTRSKLQCKAHGDNKETLVKLIWSILFAGLLEMFYFLRSFWKKYFIRFFRQRNIELLYRILDARYQQEIVSLMQMTLNYPMCTVIGHVFYHH